MDNQEKKQLKDLLKKYLGSTPMDSNQLMSVSEVLNSLEEDKSGNKLTSQELSKELEEANEFLKYVTNMCANAFGIDESELEDSNNEDSYDELVSVFDIDIKEAEKISDNLYEEGLEDADVNIDKDGNVLVYELFSDDIPHFTEAFNDAFSKDMSDQDITDYLKDAYNRYNSNKPLKDSYLKNMIDL